MDFKSLWKLGCPLQRILKFLTSAVTLFKVINKIKNGQFSEEQLTRAKNQLLNGMLRDMETKPYMFEEFARTTQQFGFFGVEIRKYLENDGR